MLEIIKRLPIKFTGTIFDVETTGFSPRAGELITVGYISGSEMHILQRSPFETEEEFREELGDLSSLPRPFFAYNKKFEERWLGFEIDEDIMENWRRLTKEWRQAGFKIRYKLEELVPTLTGVRFGVKVTSKDIIDAWKDALEASEKILQVKEGTDEWYDLFTHLLVNIRLIIIHNMDDLLRSLYLQLLGTTWNYILEPEELDRAIDKGIRELLKRA